ncbi:hypothetical protein N7522_008548 [Penicillium canescens]|uniref:Uncharacterized protein n=1 Tax=Penicillium canescens TaxID=5083 RepID=A0AAD6IFZ7_PENCN|nr:hypothetical protein N7522_008548 [Penicillium canescens]KAJ6044294.1 hypothetical protein N7460_005649 [Penicillium canescens]
MAVADPALIEGELDHVISASSTNEDYVLSSSGEPHVKTRPDLLLITMKLLHTYKVYKGMIYGLRYLKRYDDIGIILGKIADLRFMANAGASHAHWHNGKSTEGIVCWFAGALIV